jgi:hypothetical protein
MLLVRCCFRLICGRFFELFLSFFFHHFFLIILNVLALAFLSALLTRSYTAAVRVWN